MKNKGIAIQTILFLLIGILVAGLLTFYVYKYFSGGSISKEECRGMAVSWCTSCWNTMKSLGSTCPDAWNCAGGPTISEDLRNCANSYFLPSSSPIPSGSTCQNRKDFCKNFIPM